jgi:hypothetical protein
MNPNNKSISLLTLPQIAAWQIELRPEQINPDFVAELPALQRGAVWKVRQIEELWDSIFQSFPIGSFMVSPHDPKFGSQRYKFQEHAISKPTHLLLDGQQRATGIALGFLDPWMKKNSFSDVKSLLWIDLARPPTGRDVSFVFRVVTSSHPWGYLRSDPTSRISEHQMRMSLRAFKSASPTYIDSKPSQIPLTEVWPWDSEAPIPLAILIRELNNANNDIDAAKASIWQRIKKHPFMAELKVNQGPNLPADIAHWKSQQDNVRMAFEAEQSEWSSRLNDIFEILKLRVSDFVIPVTTVVFPALESANDNKQKSSIETLFMRINNSGTPLEGDELIYSLIKSAWIDAPKAIEKLTHKLATPARIALLACRLVRAHHQIDMSSTKERLNFTPTPSVDEFRRLVHGLTSEHPSFLRDLQQFVKKDGLTIFQSAHKFLTMGNFGLPPVLASELAQRSPDVFFLLLRWLYRLHESGISLDIVANRTRQRAIGFVTALAWFASPDGKPKAVAAVWTELQRCPKENLLDFFGRTNFSKTCKLDERGKLHMIPIVDPDVLQQALEHRIVGRAYARDTITEADSAIWKDWNWRSWLIEEKRPKEITDALSPFFQGNISNGDTVSDRVIETWSRFLDSAWGNRSMLIYAQREWLNKWFDDFDPSLPEFLEDKNRPWDFDHIHPQSLLQGSKGGTLRGLPQLIKDWNDSIGNLRAWPLEANRSDGDNSPAIKLDKVADEEQKIYSIKNGKAARSASFIDESHWDEYWKICVPAAGNLSQQSNHKERQALVNAIVRRFIAIYREWYVSLRLSTLT